MEKNRSCIGFFLLIKNIIVNKRLALSVFLVLMPIITFANTNEFEAYTTKHFKTKALNNKLFENRTWLKLGHYNANTFLKGYQSSIISSKFFLSKNGSTSPKEELLATIDSIFSQQQDANKAVQCLFPARFIWLKRQFPDLINFVPIQKCTKFAEWIQELKPETISLIFATGYLKNPASLYGHLLLKFNSSRYSTELLDTSINYGADIPKGEKMVLYILKGIFGGYQAKFSEAEFYNNNKLYGSLELRDLWEYTLKLTKQDIELLTAHIWEILNVRFKYFFFKRNCALEMAEALEVVMPENILNKNRPWILPHNVFSSIVKKNLVKKTKGIPSRQNLFYIRYFKLSKQEKAAVKRYINAKDKDDFLRSLNLNDNSKNNVINALLDYYAFIGVSRENAAEYKKENYRLLNHQFKLPVFMEDELVYDAVPPHKEQLPTMTQLSYFSNKFNGKGVYLRVRPAYFDSLSINYSHAPFSSLSMFDTRLKIQNKKLELNNIDFLKIKTLGLSKTDLKNDRGYAWKIRLGIEPINLQNKSHLVGFAEAGIGRGIYIGKKSAAYMMLDTRVESSDLNLSLTPYIGFVSTINKKMTVNFLLGYKNYLKDNQKDSEIYKVSMRFGSKIDWDVRLEYKKDISSEVIFSVAKYW